VTVIWVVLAVIGLAVAALLLDRGLLAAESRGWIYYRRRRAPKGAAAERMLALGSIWDPSAQHVLDQRDVEEDAKDEDPGPSDD
jgi:hypothetical protein